MFTRAHPYLARIKERYLLTKPGSTKRTYHVSLELPHPLPFSVGDSIGVLPENDPQEVAAILEALKLTGSEPIFDARASKECLFGEFLLTKANLSRVTSGFLKLFLQRGEPLQELLENKAELNQYLQSNSLLDILKQYLQIRLSAQEVASSLMPMMPRFYSIASSPKVFSNEIHLTVAYLTFECKGEIRHGVGSHFLCEMAEIESTPIPIYVQPSHGFTLPAKEASIILIGPGTGIAPFRAFLQERIASSAPGRNWLFFGERNQATDFYYKDFFLELVKQNNLRFDAAFSRDTKEKIYVQHKLQEHAASLWEWIESGAYLYICGDAEKMAKDVDAALQKIVREQGRMSEEDARIFLKRLRTEKRYLLDVY